MNIRYINRYMLIYGVLTLVLSLLYVVGVAVSQTLIAPMTGSSELGIVISTLALVAVFNPIRWRVQQQVDKRFHHRKQRPHA
jgi:hypothetical protein